MFKLCNLIVLMVSYFALSTFFVWGSYAWEKARDSVHICVFVCVCICCPVFSDRFLGAGIHTCHFQML